MDAYRLNVEVTEAHRYFLNSLPHGQRKLLIHALLDDVMEACDRSRNPDMVIAGLIARAIHVGNFSRGIPDATS